MRTGYVEKHHIIPTSLGGRNSDENIVRLTGREHFVAHWLLTKMTEGLAKRKMCYALSFFVTTNRNFQRPLTSKGYEVARKALSEARKGVKPSQNCLDALRRARKGVPLTPEAKKKIGEKLKVRHPVYVLTENDDYECHPDFYRYITQNKISRNQFRGCIGSAKIMVITSGKHKGKVIAFSDIRAETMKSVRNDRLSAAQKNRSAAVKNQWKTKKKPTGQPATQIELISPSGELFQFSRYCEIDLENVSWTSIQSCKKPLPYTFTAGKIKGWTLVKKQGNPNE